MCETICKRLRNNKKVCGVVGFGIGYSRSVGGGFYHSKKLSESTDNENVIFSVCKSIYDSYIEEEPIRKVSISLGKITDNNYVQLNLFEEVNETINEIPIVVDEINKKFGDNAILKASSLLNYSTIKCVIKRWVDIISNGRILCKEKWLNGNLLIHYLNIKIY